MERLSLSDLSAVLVEPSRAQQRIIRRALEGLGLTDVRAFASAGDGLEDMRRHPPDLVMSAMHFPDMTGVDLVHAMREDEALRQVPFLLVSSETSYRYLEPIRQAGAIGILPKPFSPLQLRRALQATLDFYDPGTLEAGELDVDSLQVLVVDDSPLSRRHVRHLLESLGIEHIAEAKNGREAQALVNERFFDLVVTDYHMPEMDGKELVEYIRNESGQAGVPILMVSSESDSRRLAAVQQAGVSAICDKPFHPAGVKRLIESLLS